MTIRASDLAYGLDRIHIRIRKERYAFRCGDCGHRWIATYEIRDYFGPTGKRWVVHCRDGEPIPAAHFGDHCPGCGRVSVTFDAGYGHPSTGHRLQTATG